MSKKSAFLVMAVVLVSFLFIGSPLFAQVRGDGSTSTPALPTVSSVTGDEPSLGWGTSDYQYLFLPAPSFVPRSSGTTFEYSTPGYMYRTGGSDGNFWAPVTLPTGVNLLGLRFYYYDNSSSDIYLMLTKYTGGSSSTDTPAYTYLIDASTSGTPGYDSVVWSITGGETISYYDNTSYIIWVYLGDTTLNQRFKGVRLYYQLQISAPPATATFTDVPTTHPFFQYIEALYDAGITTGYSGTSLYGPDDYVTRGQMAAFLARALGLQWH